VNPRMRIGVVGVFLNSEGKVLVCQRANDLGSWQFPQGGVDEGESMDHALVREMKEELGTEKFKIVKKSEVLTKYFFPKNLNSSIIKRFDGQLHHWYLLEFLDGHGPNLQSADGEFNDCMWVDPIDAIERIIDWKQEAYREGLKSMGLISV
jgi:putative (di)nucleoside polyphosphate hydrolase